MNSSIRFMAGLVIPAFMLVACSSSLSMPLPAQTSTTAVEGSLANATATAPASTRAATASTVAEGTIVPTHGSTAGNDQSDSPLGNALMKFGAASAYRSDMEMKGKGALGLSSDENNPNSPETSLFVLTGDFKGANSHYTLKGFLSSLLGVEPEAGVEAIVADGKSYVHGPVSLLGATENRWYVLEGQESDAITPPFQVSDFLSSLGNSDVQLGSFKVSGSDSVDGQKCDVLSGDKTEAAKALTALNAGTLPGVQDLSTIDNATAQFSLCDDGYIHRIELTLDISTNDKPPQKASFTVNIHMYDFNANIAITPPANAVPLQAVDNPDVTDTPGK